MKITKILPRKLAISFQEYGLNRVRVKLDYCRAMVSVLEAMEMEGNEELTRLKQK